MNSRNDALDQGSPADLADQLLSGNSSRSGPGLLDRQTRRAVELLAKARPAIGPDTGMQVRIRLKLADAWHREGSREGAGTRTGLSVLQKRQAYAFGLAVLLIAALIVGLFVVPGSVAGTPATAQHPLIGIFAAIAVILLILGILWWFLNKRK